MAQARRAAVRVVIVGGGFGGRYAAMRLAYRLPAGSELILVDRNDYMLYTPMLTEVAGRSVSPRHIQASNRELSRRIRCVQGEVRSADLRAKTVTLVDGQTLEADHLLFALGSTTSYHHVDGAEKYSLTMKTLEDARRVRTLAQRNIERAKEAESAEERKRLVSFVVAGGGYTGVETIAALNDLVHDTAEQQSVPVEELSLTIVEPMKRLMAEMPESLAAYSDRQLQRNGIRVRTGVGVQSVAAESLTLTDGEVLSAGMIIWDTGIQVNPLVAGFDCTKGKKGGIAVDSAFRVTDRPGVWAIGDCAEIPKPDGSGTFFETTAQNATREGVHVADNILATIRGQSVAPFRYKQIGELAVISRHLGVANVYGIEIKGIVGWLMWRAIYIAKMPSMRQRIGLLWDYVRLAFGRRFVPVSWRMREASGGSQSREPQSRRKPPALHLPSPTEG